MTTELPSAQTAPDKPWTVKVQPASLPQSLKAQRVWLCWRWLAADKGRWTKVPVSARTFRKCSVTDPASLATFEEAMAVFTAGNVDGVGIALEPANVLGVDLDKCRDPDTGRLTDEASAIIAALDSYSEVSPSGTGVKVLVDARKPGPRCRVGNVEAYSSGRYFALTGCTLPNSATEPQPRQEAVDALYASLFPAENLSTALAVIPSARPDASGLSDDELLAVAFRAKNGESVRRLWEGDTSGYKSHSEAEMALCALLAFYAPDPARLGDLVARSGLARDKWDRPDYRLATVTKAIASCTEFYKPRVRTPRVYSPDGRREIVIGEDQGRVNDEAADCLGGVDDVYQRGEVLVHAVEQVALPPDESGAVHQQAAGVVIRELPPALLQDRLSRLASFLRRDERGGSTELVPTAPPGWCVKAVHAMGAWPSVPVLSGVVDHPVFLRDGSILSEPGYHCPTGLLVRPPGGLAVSVSESPSRQDARDALARLRALVGDFPFQSPAHEAAWLAGLLTLVARTAFDGPAPLFMIDANTRGAGKGLLADTAALVVLGRRFPVMPYTPDEQELRKRITSFALEGVRSVLLDNLSGPIGNGVLDAALTSDAWTDRILGGNRTFAGPLALTWFATGNNCELGADTGRRTCHVRLETSEEQPELKDGFRHPDLRGHIREERSRYLSDVLTILRGWHVDGRPSGGLPAWGSFEGWSRVVRAAVVWAGMPDPGETRQELLTRADRDSVAMGGFLRELARLDPHRGGLTAAELVERAKADGELRAAIDELAGKPDTSALGYKLRSFNRRLFGGLFLDRVAEGGKGVRWAAFPSTEFAARSGKPADARRPAIDPVLAV